MLDGFGYQSLLLACQTPLEATNTKKPISLGKDRRETGFLDAGLRCVDILDSSCRHAILILPRATSDGRLTCFFFTQAKPELFNKIVEGDSGLQ